VLTHLVRIVFVDRTEFTLELDLDLEIEIPLVSRVGDHLEVTGHLFALLGGDVVLEVEHGLFPVGVGRFGRRGEAHALVAFRELDVEEGHQSLNVVVSLDCEGEGRVEGDVVFGASLDIDLFEETRVGHHLVAVDDVHQRFLESIVFDAGHVEAVDVVPPVDLVVLVLSVLDGRDVEGGAVGEHEAVGGQPLVSGVENGVQHGLVEEAVAHPLGDDDVDLFHGQFDVLHFAADHGDFVRKVIGVDNLLSRFNDSGHVDAVHVGSAGFGSEHGEDAGTTADVEDDLSLE